jgi:DNA mismatch repair protein MutS2
MISAATAEALEFPRLLAVVSQLAASDLGRERVLALRPFTDPSALAEQRERFGEAARLLLERPLVPSFELPLQHLLDRLETGRPAIEGPDLLVIADLIGTGREAASRIHQAIPPCPRLGILVRQLPDLSPLASRIHRVLDRRGEVREEASPILASLRGQIRRVRDQLYRSLTDYMGQHRDDLAEETIPLRAGRLVLLQSAGAGTRGGLVHGRSATGKSVYFEPLAVVESNNSLQQAIEDEEAEKKRLVLELVTAAEAAQGALREHAELLAELDLLQASVRFGEVSKGRLADMTDPDAPVSLRLLSARHPLLDPALAPLREAALGQPGHEGAVIPLDLELSADRRVLVITGPNAGGKTVALKTAGLLSLASSCGLPIPVGPGSRVPALRRLVATVGDEQDLLNDRSTFSGRLLRLREAWEAAAAGTLVLLDELGSGTDPDEGAALSIVLLEMLIERGAIGVITTHLGQLAAAALELPGAFCAAMEFDGPTGRPTFHLVPGPPGGSEAIALGRRLGLPSAWLDRAEARLGPEHRDLRRLLAEVESIRREVSGLREQLRRDAEESGRQRRQLEAEKESLEEERRETARRGKIELDGFRRATTERLGREVERLTERFEAGRRKGLAAESVQRLFSEAPDFKVHEELPSGPLVVGAAVQHRTLGWHGTLEKLSGEKAEVLVRGKRVRCGADELSPASSASSSSAGAKPPRERAPTVLAARGSANDLESAPGPGPEINLIGQRVEPALIELDVYLDRALFDSLKEVRVIHGHGTGRLRTAVRGHLRGHPAVASLREGAQNEGGNGATVVTLRGAGL